MLLVPHSNHADVAFPFGFTVPFNVEVAVAIKLAASVVTDGKLIGVAVVKLYVPDQPLVPLALVALTRQ